VEYPEENQSLLNNERDLSESENLTIPGEAGEHLTVEGVSIVAVSKMRKGEK
jgi:hypothetical protein